MKLIKFFALVGTLVLTFSCSSDNTEGEHEVLQKNESIIDNSMARRSITIKATTGMTSFHNQPCFEAWDICIEISWGASNSLIAMDYDNQTITMTLDTKDDASFYSQKTASGKFELIGNLYIPSDITSEFSSEGKDVYIESGLHDFSAQGDLIVVSTTFKKL